ncbi:uncharacterized protein PRCAT00000321001 [Priceomyces carsonii]|uniref:uncharacterized protein n=1 Tax=Priceomyces carsonii TaxID=28549 RepID=UPI002ED9F878|nr:unnamed protein product [Priceomyces carsonii]
MIKVLVGAAILPLLPNVLASYIGRNQAIFEVPGIDGACPIDLPITCSNSTPIENKCCFESPGGIFLQTQFWDYYPPIGDNDTFTLHGLWPDNCDGSYEQFCDDTMNIDKAGDIVLNQFGDKVLYEKMKKHWKNFNGDDDSLWVHEFNKHGTCVKTLYPTCYRSFIANKNVVDYFNISMKLYESLPTFKLLEADGIVPSTTETYTKRQIADALSKGFGGHNVYFKCNKYRALQEIWYYHYLHGSIKQQQFLPISSLLTSNCPEEGIKFLPKSGWKPPPTTPNPPPSSPGKGYIKISNHNGCLISNGEWYQYGTCATFQIFKLQFGGYNLKSSKGFCGISPEGQLQCNRAIQPSKFQFQYEKSSGVIGYGGVDSWCFNKEASHGPGKYQQVPVMIGKGECQDKFQLKLI